MTDTDAPELSDGAASDDRGTARTPADPAPMAQLGTEAKPLVINSSPMHNISREIPRSVRLAADWTWRLLLFTAVFALFVVVLGRLQAVVLPVFLGLLFAALLGPVTARLRRLKVPNALAALAGVLIILIGLVGGLGLVARSAVNQIQQLGPTLSNGVDELRKYLQTGPLHLGSQRVDALAKSASDALSSGSTYTSTVASGASAGVSLLGGFVLMMFVLFFFLKDGPTLRAWCVRGLPKGWRDRADQAADEVWSALGSYTRGAVMVAAFDGLFIGIGLLLLGVPLALSLALLTFLAAFVPIVGAVVAGSLAVLVALAAKGFGTALVVLGLVLLVQQIEGNVLHPVIMRRAVELHPIVVVVAVAAGGTIAGIAGAALAVPVVAIVRVTVGSLRRNSPPPTYD
ncbi:MAG TPA: AI-2E family transporter [Frankiaceae bacterium]|nr:AI-2E family transporter [Frankiaceae bacterium]